MFQREGFFKILVILRIMNLRLKKKGKRKTRLRETGQKEDTHALTHCTKHVISVWSRLILCSTSDYINVSGIHHDLCYQCLCVLAFHC